MLQDEDDILEEECDEDEDADSDDEAGELPEDHSDDHEVLSVERPGFGPPRVA